VLELIAAATTIHPNLFGTLWVLAAIFSLGLFVQKKRSGIDSGANGDSLADSLPLARLWLVAFGPLLLISLVSTVSTNVALSRIEVAEILIGGAFLAAGIKWIRLSKEKLMQAAVIGALAAVVVAIVDLTVFDYGRAGRSFHPINFAVSVGCLVIVLAYGFLQAQKPSRFVIGLGLIAGLVALLLSESRGPMLALILTFIAMGVVALFSKHSSREGRSKMSTWVWVAGGITMATLLAAAGFRTVQEMQELGENASIQVRLQILIATLRQIQETPLFGIGADQAGQFFAAVSLSEQGINHAHSTLLNTALELGLPGGLAWCWAFGLIGWTFLKSKRLIAPANSFAWQVGLSLVLFFFICSLTQDLLSHSFTRKLMTFYLIIFLAMLAQEISTASLEQSDRKRP
jgi:O-antigen ligase